MSESGEGTSGAGSALIYCGLCGALNPASRHYCSACGTTLVDAFHATEGIRVFERADPAARIVEIIPSGSELEIVEGTMEVPADWVRVRMVNGKLGFVRISDVGEGAPQPIDQVLPDPDINKHARGCVSTGAALGALGLAIIMALFGLVIILRARAEDAGILWLFYCITIIPLMAMTIGLYVGARGREDRIAQEAEEIAASRRASIGQDSPPPFAPDRL
ncbi:MAG: hypothetical protein ACR2J8_05700 [Thermomicrobiales bacterium]